MRLHALRIPRVRGRRHRALTAALATLTIAGGALGASTASAQAAGWTTTYPTAASLGGDISAADAPGGNLSNTSGSICTTGTTAQLQAAFVNNVNSTYAGITEGGSAITAQEVLVPGGNWAPYGTSSIHTTNYMNDDFVESTDGRFWWSPEGDDVNQLNVVQFPSGVSQLSCSYFETAVVTNNVRVDPGTGDDEADAYDTFELVGTPTTTTYEIEPNGDPTISFATTNPASGSWADGAQPITLDVGNLSTGDNPEVVCATPGGVYTGTAANGSVTIPGSYGASSGTNTYSCQAINQVDETSSTVSLSFNVDSTTPSGGVSDGTEGIPGGLVAPNPPAGPWDVPNVNYTGTDEYTISIGPSGLASGSCVVSDTDTNVYPGSGAIDPDAGATTTYQLTGANALSAPSGITNPAGNGAGTYEFSVPLYQGQNTVRCSAQNGAGASSPVYTASPLADSVMPSVAFTGGAGTVTEGSTIWINTPTGRIDLTALAGASGLATPLTGAQAGTGPAEDPNDASIACTPSNSNVAIGSPTSTSLITGSDLTTAQTVAGYVIGVQNIYQPTGTGLTTLDCVSMNGAGVYQNGPLAQAVGIDTVTPSITLADGSAVSATSDQWSNSWQASVPTVTVDASTAGASGIAGVTCTVDGTPVTPSAAVSNPTSGAGAYRYTLPSSAFSDGGNTVSCVGTSGDDLTSQPDSQTLNVDMTQPTIAAAGLPSNGWQTSQDISFDARTGQSGVASVTCTVDGSPHLYTPSTATSTWAVGVPLGGDGEHTVDCSVTNGAGVTAGTGPVTIGTDDQTPGISWTGVPASQWVSSSVPVAITGTAGPSGVKSVTCQLDGGAWTTMNGKTASVAIADSGTHTIGCYDTSNAGLESTVQTQNVQVDTAAPSESFSGAASDTWLTNAPDQAVTVNATAGPSGVAAIDCTIDGVAQPAVNPSGEQYDAATGTYRAAAAFAIVGNGQHTVACQVINGAQVATKSESETIDIDASTPGLALTANGQPLVLGWVAGSQSVVATATVGPSGVSQTANGGQGGLECAVDGGPEHITSSSVEQIQVAGDGPHSINCSVQDSANLSYTLPTQTLRIDSVVPSIALSGTSFGTWLKTDQAVTVTAQAGQSGLSTPVCYVDGRLASLTPVPSAAVPAPSAGYTSAAAWTFSVAGTGNHAVQCDETSGAGQTSSTAVQHVQISEPTGTDSGNDPGQLTQYGSTPSIDADGDPYSSGPSQTSWSTGPQTVVITATPPAGAAPIAAITCSGAAGLQGSGNYPADPSNETASGGEQIKVTVADPGGDLVCIATDQAGNTYQLGSYAFLVDSHAPTGALLARSKWPEPNEMAVHVTDGVNGSGVKSVALSLTAKRTKETITATYSPSTGNWLAAVNDGVLPAGAYRVVITATDNAGNTGTIARRPLRLPLRAPTKLTVSAGISTTARTRSGSRKISRTVAKTRQAAVTIHRGSLTIAYGQKVELSGTLRDVKTDKPLAHAQLTVSGTPESGGSSVTLVKLSTNADGSYRYTLAAAESRTVTIAYAGSATALGSVASFKQRVPGEVTARIAPRLQAGKVAVLTGEVLGGYVPAHGVQLHVEYQIPGETRGWSLFQAAHTRRDGRYAVRFPVSGRAGGYTYRLRVVIPAQSGWPFQSTESVTLVRKIGGRA
jgi:hypothetical protein